MLCPLADVIANLCNHRRFRVDVVPSDEVLILPPHNTEIFNAGFMTCDVIMVINWGGGLKVIRAIKEAIYIRVNNPSLNRNIGKYHLPHILDEVLLNNKELKLKLSTQWQ